MMKNIEQEYNIEIKESFCLNHIFECGQCFRWKKEDDESYTGVFKNSVINVKKENDIVTFRGVCEKDIKEVVNEYFDLNTDYGEIKNTLSKVDSYLAESIKYGNGIRILNQDLWEVIISFIISANNNIPRIQKIIERLSNEYGNKIIYEEKEYYTFPEKEQLAKASIEDLRSLGLGFRDKYVYETTRKIINGDINLEELGSMQDTNKIREVLLTLPGIGPKVADCIMLFGMHKFDVFPVDVWVRRVMNELYLKNEDETKINKKQIETLAKEKYKNLAGIAQQYLFYWKRDTA